MSRVRSVRNQRAVNEFVQAAKARHVRARANELRDIAKDEHRTAPRGGPGINRFGELRSPEAGGTAPAMETGRLFALIDQGVTVESAFARVQATVVVNFGFGPGKGSMEDGTRRMAPRPLGRISLARFTSSLR